jgi:D-alanyl-D-alanine carboxypeptidase
MIKFLFFITITLFSSVMAAQENKLDHAVQAEMKKWHSPGAAIALLQNGRLLLAKGYGFANLQQSVPVTPDTKFYLGSMTKQFTATAIMMLVEEGKILADERIVKYLPNLAATYRDVTVNHLLTHTSGITRDFRKQEGSMMGDELYAAMANTSPEFHPGKKVAYSNTGYILLGMIVEAVTGKSYGEALSERIFKPLGMTSTQYVAPDERPEGVATGYEWMDGNFQKVLNVPHRFSAGSLVSTVLDLGKWDAALHSNKLLKISTANNMTSATPLTDGSAPILGWDDLERMLEVGKGWFISTHFGHKLVHHGGNIDGFSAQIDRFVNSKVTVIALANNEAHAAINIAAAVATLSVPNLDFDGAPSQVQQARLAFRDKKFQQACRLFVAALEKGDRLPSTAYSTARCFTLLGEKEKALAFLEKAAQMGYSRIDVVKTDEVLNPLHENPRWTVILEKISSNSKSQ